MNTGALEPKFKISDWIADGFSPLVGRGIPVDWSKFLPVWESQRFQWGDSMACDYFATTNVIESQYTNLTGVERNFSDRWLAKMGKNTRGGSSMEQGPDAARKYGLVDESLWTSEASSWDEYYKDIPQEIIDKGKEFLKDWVLYREWVKGFPENIHTALFDTPLIVFVKYASGNGILNPSGVPDHFVMAFASEYKKFFYCFDHYEQKVKKYAWDYNFRGVLKLTLLKRTNNIMTIPNDTLLQLVQGSGGFGMFLNGKIIIDDTDKILASFIVRNNGDIKGRSKTMTLEDWGKYEHVNLKGEKAD